MCIEIICYLDSGISLVQTFPREFGTGSSTSIRNILATIRDLRATYRVIFSRDYDLPANRCEQPVIASDSKEIGDKHAKTRPTLRH